MSTQYATFAWRFLHWPRAAFILGRYGACPRHSGSVALGVIKSGKSKNVESSDGFPIKTFTELGASGRFSFRPSRSAKYRTI